MEQKFGGNPFVMAGIIGSSGAVGGRLFERYKEIGGDVEAVDLFRKIEKK